MSIKCVFFTLLMLLKPSIIMQRYSKVTLKTRLLYWNYNLKCNTYAVPYQHLVMSRKKYYSSYLEFGEAIEKEDLGGVAAYVFFGALADLIVIAEGTRDICLDGLIVDETEIH